MTIITTSWSNRPVLQNDYGYLLDDLSNIITDNLDNQIFFHTGIFYDYDTTWSSRKNTTASGI